MCVCGTHTLPLDFYGPFSQCPWTHPCLPHQTREGTLINASPPKANSINHGEIHILLMFSWREREIFHRGIHTAWKDKVSQYIFPPPLLSFFSPLLTWPLPTPHALYSETTWMDLVDRLAGLLLKAQVVSLGSVWLYLHFDRSSDKLGCTQRLTLSLDTMPHGTVKWLWA